MNDVGPHHFAAISRLVDSWRPNGRCRACYLPKWAHPTLTWVQLRSFGDKRMADLRIQR